MSFNPRMALKLLKRNRLYDGKVFSVVVDEVEYPSGNKSIREVAEHPGGSVAVALLPPDRLIMVRQHRYPIDKTELELPAGKLNPGEDPLECVVRELEEETGYVGENWRKLTAIYTTPGFCTEQLHIFLTTDVKPSSKGQTLEEGEYTMSVEIIPLHRAVEMIERQEIVDGKTICGILLAERLLRKTQLTTENKKLKT